MKFIHAVVFDRNEFDNLREHGIDLCNWDDLCDGDYVVHCLYDADTEKVLIHEDNTHQPVEAMIENFLDGVRYANNEKVIVKKAGVVVNEGKSPYDADAVIYHLRDLYTLIDWEAL